MSHGLITIAFGIVLGIPWMVRRKALSMGPRPDDHFVMLRPKVMDVGVKVSLGLGVGLVVLGAVMVVASST